MSKYFSKTSYDYMVLNYSSVCPISLESVHIHGEITEMLSC